MELTNESERLKRIIVTGARGALGTEVVEQFVEAGCTVIGADLVVEHDEIQSDPDHHRLYWAKLDATKSADVRRFCSAVVDEFGAIDGLVHCAGGFRFAHADAIADEDVEFLIDANLRSTILMLRETLKSMKEEGFGRVVLVSSASTLQPGGGVSTYAATKAGLNALVESISNEVRELDINVNAILPSVIDTDANRDDMPDADFAKWVAPTELASIIFALSQPLMKSVRGALLPVTGGM